MVVAMHGKDVLVALNPRRRGCSMARSSCGPKPTMDALCLGSTQPVHLHVFAQTRTQASKSRGVRFGTSTPGMC